MHMRTCLTICGCLVALLILFQITTFIYFEALSSQGIDYQFDALAPSLQCVDIISSHQRQQTYGVFDSHFKQRFGNQSSAIFYEMQKYLDLLQQKHCQNIDDKIYVFQFADYMEHTNVAVLSMRLDKNHRRRLHDRVAINAFNDYRILLSTLSNHLEFAQQNGYFYIYLTDYLYHFNNSKMEQTPHFQKIFLIARFLKRFKWIIWLDQDALVCNIYHKLQNNVRVAFDWLHDIIEDVIAKNGVSNRSDISFIFSHDEESTLNAGLFMIKNDAYGNSYVDKWLFMETNFRGSCSPENNKYPEQEIMSAVVQGFDPFNRTHTCDKQAKYQQLCQRNSVIDHYRHEYPQLNKNNFYRQMERLVFDEYNSKHAFVMSEKHNPAHPAHTSSAQSSTFMFHFYSRCKYSNSDKLTHVFDVVEYITNMSQLHSLIV
eukprot:53956_1